VAAHRFRIRLFCLASAPVAAAAFSNCGREVNRFSGISDRPWWRPMEHVPDIRIQSGRWVEAKPELPPYNHASIKAEALPSVSA
jgi:hypothetical protein